MWIILISILIKIWSIDISDWLFASKLTLNTSKTEFMLIGSRKKFKILKTALSLIINGGPIKHSTIVWMLRALWLVVVHELLEYRYMDDVTGNLFSLFCSTWRTVLQDYIGLSTWKPRKQFTKSHSQTRKMVKRRQKEFLATWECLNCRKISQQLILCHRHKRLSVLKNVLAIILHWASWNKFWRNFLQVR